MKTIMDILTPGNIQFMIFTGAKYSLLLAIGALFFGVILGIIGAALKLSKHFVLRAIGNVYVEIFRGTPMLLQIMFLYLAVPTVIQSFTGQRFQADPYVCGLIAMSLNSGAYQVELIRSGILGVDKGQWEACETIGLNYVQTMRYVILPQAFKRIIPPLISEFITLIKDSSLIFTIGAVELLATASVIGANTFNYLVPLTATGAIYLVMTLCISAIARYVEGRLAVSD